MRGAIERCRVLLKPRNAPHRWRGSEDRQSVWSPETLQSTGAPKHGPIQGTPVAGRCLDHLVGRVQQDRAYGDQTSQPAVRGARFGAQARVPLRAGSFVDPCMPAPTRPPGRWVRGEYRDASAGLFALRSRPSRISSTCGSRPDRCARIYRGSRGGRIERFAARGERLDVLVHLRRSSPSAASVVRRASARSLRAFTRGLHHRGVVLLGRQARTRARPRCRVRRASAPERARPRRRASRRPTREAAAHERAVAVVAALLGSAPRRRARSASAPRATRCARRTTSATPEARPASSPRRTAVAELQRGRAPRRRLSLALQRCCLCRSHAAVPPVRAPSSSLARPTVLGHGRFGGRIGGRGGGRFRRGVQQHGLGVRGPSAARSACQPVRAQLHASTAISSREQPVHVITSSAARSTPRWALGYVLMSSSWCLARAAVPMSRPFEDDALPSSGPS